MDFSVGYAANVTHLEVKCIGRAGYCTTDSVVAMEEDKFAKTTRLSRKDSILAPTALQTIAILCTDSGVHHPGWSRDDARSELLSVPFTPHLHLYRIYPSPK